MSAFPPSFTEKKSEISRTKEHSTKRRNGSQWHLVVRTRGTYDHSNSLRPSVGRVRTGCTEYVNSHDSCADRFDICGDWVVCVLSCGAHAAGGLDTCSSRLDDEPLI